MYPDEVNDLFEDMAEAVFVRDVPFALAMRWEEQGQTAWLLQQESRRLVSLAALVDPRSVVLALCELVLWGCEQLAGRISAEEEERVRADVAVAQGLVRTRQRTGEYLKMLDAWRTRSGSHDVASLEMAAYWAMSAAWDYVVSESVGGSAAKLLNRLANAVNSSDSPREWVSADVVRRFLSMPTTDQFILAASSEDRRT